MAQHLITGKKAENLALTYLQGQALKLVARNWHCAYGEIDLIMQDNKILVFIEVRYRQQANWGLPIETITKAKQKKIITTAQLFLQKNKQWLLNPCRFDVISITDNINEHPNIDWLTNAFSIN